MTVRSSNEGNEGKSLSEPASPNVKLYVVVACIAALVLVAIVQVVFFCPEFGRLWFLLTQQLTPSLGELHYIQNEPTRVFGAQGDNFA